MIFLLAALLLLTAWRVIVAARQSGLRPVLKGYLVASVCGLLAGVFIGVGARVGMGAISIANGSPLRFSVSGTIQVVAVFSSLGIVLGVLYEGLFRSLLRRSGLAYGVLLTLFTWYSLAQAAAQELTGHPSVISLAVVSGLLIALMWLPFGVALEALVRKWQMRGRAPLVEATT